MVDAVVGDNVMFMVDGANDGTRVELVVTVVGDVFAALG